MNLARALRIARDIPGHTEADVRAARNVLGAHLLVDNVRGLRFPEFVGAAFDRTDDYLNALDGVAA